MATVDEFVDQLDKLPEEIGLLNYGPALEECADLIRDGVEVNFFRSEDSDGIPWPPHSPVTVKQHGPHPLLILSGDMLSAAANKGQGHIEDIDRKEAEIGIDSNQIPYAMTQQKGDPSRNIPAREYFYATDDTLDECERIITDFFQANVFPE